MKTRILFSLCALLLPTSLLSAEPLAPHGWSENAREGNFTKEGDLTPIEERMAKPTHTIGVLIPSGDKLVVKDVMEGSPAQKAGIEAMDEIVEINDIKLSGIEALRGLISAAGAQELEIMVRRGEGAHVFAITPEPVKVKSADREPAGDSPPAEMEPGAPWNQAGTQEREHREHRDADRDHGEERVEQLLGQILAEMKTMNDRENRMNDREVRWYDWGDRMNDQENRMNDQENRSPRIHQGAPGETPRRAQTQPAQPAEGRQPGPRVVLPQAPQLGPEAGPREPDRPAETSPARNQDPRYPPRQKGTD